VQRQLEMSKWFTGLAGKAEDFLNTLDTSAASALNKSGHADPESAASSSSPAAGLPPPPLPPPPLVVDPPSRHSPLGRSPSQASLGSAAVRPAPPSASGSNKRVDKDAELMDLLNSEAPLDSLVSGRQSAGSMLSSTPTPTGAESAPPQPPPPKVSAQHSRQSSVASSFSKYSASEIKAEMAAAAAAASSSAHVSTSVTGAVSTFVSQSAPTPAASASAASVVMTEDNPPAEIENKLLRSEISSLNQELSSLLKRNQSAQDASRRLEADLTKCRQQLKQAEEAVAAGQAREQQLSDLLHSRDAQIAEMSSAHEALRDQLELMRADSTRSAGFQQAAFDELNERLRQAEARLEQEQAASASLQADLRRLRQDAEQQQAMSAQAGRALAEEQRRQRAQALELEAAQRRCQQAQAELRDYKEKAGRILQVKDKMIATLKKGNGSEGGNGGGGLPDAADAAVGSSVAELSAEVDALRQERELLREEAQRAKLAAEGLRCDVEDLEAQMQSESETFRKTMSGLEAQLESERLARLAAEEEAQAARREASQQRDLWLRDKSELSQRLAQAEAELDALRRQSAPQLLRSGAGTSVASGGQDGGELEARIRSLTESLIQKQTALESSNAEKASLRLMVEQLESRLSERTHHATSLAQESGLSSRSSQAPQSDYIRIHMQDPPYARHMKRAVNTLDKAGVKLGVFLRRYPMARMLFLAYIGLLHLWVLLVLLTYQPEMHQRGYNDALPQPPGAPALASAAGSSLASNSS
uniref:Golgin-84 n=2 Tax=Macrostomum lignano TaxID=282301 RepID=A0A1I8I1N0_9PLAT